MRTPRSKPARLTSDELVGRPLEPGRHHPAVVVPDAAEALPVAGVAPDDPALDDVADLLPVAHRRSISAEEALELGDGVVG